MLKTSITDAKNGFSALIEQVRSGQTVLITDRDQPVARIEPVTPADLAEDPRIAKLERAGLITRPRVSGGVPDDFFKRVIPTAPPGLSVLQAVLDERREGR